MEVAEEIEIEQQMKRKMFVKKPTMDNLGQNDFRSKKAFLSSPRQNAHNSCQMEDDIE